MSKASKLSLADRLHRGFVWGCIGLTLLTALNIGVKGYEYLIYVRPIRKLEEGKLEQELLKEGRGISDGEELSA